MGRKEFIARTSWVAFGLTTFGSIMKTEKGNFVGDCETTNDILGPFYRANSPIRADLTYEGLSGTRITLKGTVYQSDCITPLKNALVEIWHCNTEGEYDNDSKDFRQRGSLYTQATGEYAFTTIIPGKYLNGELYRPSHIHFRVTERHSKELISPIYFQGDPDILADPWASEEKAPLRILQIVPEDIKGNLAITFDIYLKEKK